MAQGSRSTPPRWWSKHTPAAQDLLLAARLHARPIPMGWLANFGASAAEIDDLLGESLLLETPAGLAATGELARADPASLAPESARRRIHLLLAGACQRYRAHLEAAAEHFESAGARREASETFFAAAEIHCTRHRHAAAKRCFFRGLALLPEDTPDATVTAALQGIARCAALAGEPVSAANELRVWSTTPPWSERPTIRAEANLALAALLTCEGRHIESARARRAAARDLGALGRDRECLEAALAAATGLAFTGQVVFAREAVEAAFHAAQRVGDPAMRASAQTLHGLILGMLGETREALEQIHEALALALRHHLTGAAAEAYRLLGTVQEYASLYPDEQTAFASALRYCREHDEHHTAGICLGCLAYSCLRSGRWRRCEETARRVIADRSSPRPSRHVAESVHGLLLAFQGQPRPAARLLHTSLEGCRQIGLLLMDFFNLLGLALVDEMQGDPTSAAARYQELLDFWRGTDDRHDAIPGLSAAVVFFAAQRRRDDAAAAAEALDRIASLTANPESAGAAHAATAELALLDGDATRAAAGFRRALAAYEQRELALEPIHTRVRLATALAHLGSVREAGDLARAARQRARRLGARPLIARAEALLSHRSGAEAPLSPKPAAVPAAWALLSARQREVARELARGRTNKEIAAALGVSVRTIDMHVAHVLARLDCRTRTEAAARIGPVAP